ncbi:hypothetical protein MAC_02231 [Metarhizium acridum CQMa 102]|uniref:Ecp2 effector protein domain-containing protein n=1 Tax=Metarhizium acridum (strain CQMa 102) TaxID=655827 RepID=E9DX83_METAQ|nr:uncharacterized protein MAC_02231 [Metarhizium acridum CQMa 102]EFY91641.1 hypothetical protein MAC_02231 [Metarhizium acridum CQMa 102]
MQLSSFTTTLALAATALASPACNKPNPNPNPSPSPNGVSGKDTNGSIFMFGDLGNCRSAFRDHGACGLSTYFKDIDPDKLSLVALPSGIFDPHGQAQNNKLCGKVITMTYNGVSKQAVVADENKSSEQSIDMCLDMWEAFGGRDGDGTLLKGIEWSIAA